MIVRDEANFLRDCLNSVKSIVDEIIIVDTGSEDNSVGIAESFGARIFHHTWNDDFSEARNLSLVQATKDWILVMDGDETVSESDLSKIRLLISAEEADGYSLVQRNYFKDRKPSVFEISTLDDSYPESKKYTGWYPSELVRLFKNHRGYVFSGMVHELVSPSITSNNGKIRATKIPIHHFRVDKPESFDLNKKEKYLRIGQRQIELTPNEPKPYYEIGHILMANKEYEKAINYLEKALQLIESSARPLDYQKIYLYVLSVLGRTYFEKNQYQKAIDCFVKLSKYYSHPELFLLMALSYTNLGRPNDAINSYKQAIELNPQNPELHNNLANLYTRTQQFENAVSELRLALKLRPGDGTIHRNLGAAYACLGRYANAYESFQKSIELNPEFKEELEEGLKRLEELKNRSQEPD